MGRAELEALSSVIDAMPRGGEILIAVRVHEMPAGRGPAFRYFAARGQPRTEGGARFLRGTDGTLTMRDLFGGRPGSEIDRIAREWVQRVALRQMTAAQADALRQWCQADPRHGAAFAEAHRLWRAMAPAAALSEARPRAASVASGASRLSRRGPGMRRDGGGRGRGRAAIRPVAVLARIGRRLSHRQGEQRRVVLPGTAVLDLNTRTSARCAPPASS